MTGVILLYDFLRAQMRFAEKDESQRRRRRRFTFRSGFRSSGRIGESSLAT